MIDNITGKRIFLMCENFYDYDILIYNNLLKLGAMSVYLHDIAWLPSIRNFNLRHIKEALKDLIAPYYYKKWINQLKSDIGDQHFDIFLCVPYTPFDKDFMQWLQMRDPQLKCILFLWDTISDVQKWRTEIFHYFDKVWTFDRDDAKQYGISYHPDFCVTNESVPYAECKFDISFVGSLSGNKNVYDRPRILHYIEQFCKEHQLSSYLYLKYFPIRRAWKARLNGGLDYYNAYAPYSQCHFLQSKTLPIDVVDEIQNQSRVILDLTHQGRQGITINAITALSKGKKLITTNDRIASESFYDPDSICIIDSNNPHLDIDFFKSSAPRVDIGNLRIDRWLQDIVNFE